MHAPLEGMRVLNTSSVLAGPYAAMMLGDLGADVVKVEEPLVGDQTRGWGPPFQGDQSAYFLSANRNSRSLTLNLKHPLGARIFSELISRSDVLIENFRAGGLDRFGFSKQTLSELNPKLIHCSITGYGHEGEFAGKPVYDLILQAETGWMSLTGEPTGKPLRIGVAILDLLAAHFAVQGILSALWRRIRHSEEGQTVKVNMYDTAIASLCYMAQYYLTTGKSPPKMGSQHPTIVPYQAFQSADGYVVIAVASEAIWKRFCHALDRQDLLRDGRFQTNASRVKHRQDLLALLEVIIKCHSTCHWIKVFEAHDVPVSLVNNLEQALNSPEARTRKLVQHVPHPTLGKVCLLGPPLQFSSSRCHVRHAPPLLGQNTDEVLRELGYCHESITQLRESHVI